MSHPTPAPRHAAAATSKIERSLRVLERALGVHTPTALGTAFNIEGAVLLHLVATRLPQYLPALEVFSIDTGRLPDETHAYAAHLADFYDKRIRLYSPPPEPVEEFVHTHGAQRDRSVESLRREQSAERAGVCEQISDPELGVEKFAPLAAWTRREVEDFATAEQVPVHPLYARGYLSIGCAPCTRAVSAGEAERAGRWWWESPEAGKECGLHPATPQAPLRFHPPSGPASGEVEHNPHEPND